MLQAAILPIGEVDVRVLETLRQRLNSYPLFTLNFTLLPAAPLPKKAYNLLRKQYRASYFLELARLQTRKYEKVLGVTAVDLYTPPLNFIFGQAELHGRAAVISIYRLRAPEDPQLEEARMLKEAVHELGHAFGLNHCRDKYCVMHFSNCLLDTDIKSERYCDACLRKLKQRE